MRKLERVIIIIAVIVFITAVGSGIFDIYIQYFKNGVTTFVDLGRHSTEGIIALIALAVAGITAYNSIGGKNKRKK